MVHSVITTCVHGNTVAHISRTVEDGNSPNQLLRTVLSISESVIFYITLWPSATTYRNQKIRDPELVKRPQLSLIRDHLVTKYCSCCTFTMALQGRWTARSCYGSNYRKILRSKNNTTKLTTFTWSIIGTWVRLWSRNQPWIWRPHVVSRSRP